ncbi:hypothetical protein [Dyella acidiphila]|uniref:DUF2946 domain-containing protein n=1 Tax=Dyella acidiphila TaxID=2775866 RepID=A0ABR9GD12_9GAMM|nr:hypothetical protein [Dyella acidiphila]MBE1161929.1 hypothetical protein [Dyella acidiphila]
MNARLVDAASSILGISMHASLRRHVVGLFALLATLFVLGMSLPASGAEMLNSHTSCHRCAADVAYVAGRRLLAL